MNSLSGPASALVASSIVALWVSKQNKEHTDQIVSLYKEVKELSIQATKAIENNTDVVKNLVANDQSIREKQDQIHAMTSSILDHVKR